MRAVADASEIMPQKTTFFYPKIASGAVINPILADETLFDPISGTAVLNGIPVEVVRAGD